MDLSVVIPVYNEEENIEPLIREINATVSPQIQQYEIIIVDDGSRDATFQVLSRLHQDDTYLRVIRLKRNFGQTAAIAAGLAYAQGKNVVMMEGEGEKNPRDIT